MKRKFCIYYQYLKERFPLRQFLPLSLIFALSASIAAQFHLYGKIENFLSIVLTFFTLLFFLFRLRIFDELKDFDHDLKYYPDRPVARGAIKLKDLTNILFVFLIFEIIIPTAKGTETLIFFSIALLYSLLMFKEFFIREWLRKNFTAYILLHEALLFPLFFYIYSLNGLLLKQVNYPFFWLLTFFLGSQLFLLEVTRKMRSKESEIASKDTYTAQYGIRGASFLAGFLALISVVAGILSGKILNIQINVFSYFLFAVLMWFILSVIFFMHNPNKINAKKVFNTSIFFVILANFSLLLMLL